MAKYGTFRYGTGTKYGTGAASTQPTFTGSLIWICGVEWNGSYSGTSERMIDYRSSRGSAYTIAASGGGFEPLQIGNCTVVLDNHDDRYNPYNTGSPLYPYVSPGKKIFIDAVDVATGTHYQRFSGRIENITPHPFEKTVSVDCKDFGNDLEREDVTLPIKFSTNTSDAIHSVLVGAGWSKPTNIHTSDNPLTLFTVDEQNALGVIDQLTQGSLGYAFTARDGTFTYYDRTYNSMASHTVDQAVVLKDLPVKSPWDTTRKTITVYANKWARTQIKTIWTCPDSIFLAVGETKTFTIELPNPCEIIPPVSGLDYSNGPGIVSISGSTITWGTIFSLSISNITGKGCTFTVHNNVTTPQFLYNLRLRGREYVQSYSTKQDRGSWRVWVPTPQQDTSTKKKYIHTNGAVGGKFVLDVPYLQDGNFADAYSSSISSALATPDLAPTLKFDTRGSDAFPIELGDKIVVTSAKLDINNTFYCLKIEERWTKDTGQSYETIIYTGRRILCNTSITPEPIPDGGGGDGPITTIPTDPTLPPTTPGTPPEKYPDSCMITVDAPVTGPYALQFDRTTVYPGQSAFAMFPCGLRKAGAVNGSYIDLYNASAYGNSYQYYQVFAVDNNKSRILTGVHDTNYFDVTSTFSPLQGLSIAGFEVFLPINPPAYLPGSTWYTSQGLEYMRIAPSPSNAGIGNPGEIHEPVNVNWPGTTDFIAFNMTAVAGVRLDQIWFDYGTTAPAGTGFGVRYYGVTVGSSMDLMVSNDAVAWSSDDAWRHDVTLNNWTTGTWDISGWRYFGVRTWGYGTEGIAYAYLSNTAPGITGYIALGNQNRAWNVCAIPETTT